MANQNVKANAGTALVARLGKRAKNKPGDLSQLAEVVWDALETARGILESSNTAEQLKACHAVFQGASAYAKVVQVGELEARLEVLEQAAGLRQGAASNPNQGAAA